MHSFRPWRRNHLEQIEPVSTFFLNMLPPILIGLAVGFVWRVICKRIYRQADQEFKLAMVQPVSYEALPIDDKISIKMTQLSIARRGSPSDRLFLLSFVIVSLLVATYTGLWLGGVTPASKLEREWMAEVAPLSPTLQKLHEQIANGSYISRGDYLLMSEVFGNTKAMHGAPK